VRKAEQVPSYLRGTNREPSRQSSVEWSSTVKGGGRLTGGGSNTGPSVSDGLVGDGELGKVVSSHLGLDLDGVWGEARG
jgi:hypothetical protein